MTWLPLIVLVGFAVLWPLVSFEARGFVSGIDAYRAAYSLPRIQSAFQATAFLAVTVTPLALLLGVLLAWCVSHLPPRIERLGSILALLPLLVPAVPTIVGWVILLAPRIGYVNSALRLLPPFAGLEEGPLSPYGMPGIIFVSALHYSGFIYLFVYSGLRSRGDEYEAAASVCGASPMRAFLTVTIQQLRPSLAYGTGLVLLLSLGEFTAPLLLGSQAGVEVLTTRIFGLIGGFPESTGVAAALSASLLAAGAIVVIAQRWFIGDIRRYTSSGRVQHSPPRTFWWTSLVVGSSALLAIAPVIALTYVSVSPFWTAEVSLSNLTLRQFDTVLFKNAVFSSAILLSLTAPLITIGIVLPLGYLTARVIARRVDAPNTVSRFLDLLVLLPYGVPGTVFGFGLLFAYTRPPFVLYGTPAVIIVAYCTVMLPYATRFMLARLLSIDQESWDASHVSGAGPLRTFVSVTVPLMRGSAAAAAAIIFVLLFREFNVSLMVRAPTVQVAGSILYDAYTIGVYPTVAAVGVLMVLIAVLGASVAAVAGGANALRGGAHL